MSSTSFSEDRANRPARNGHSVMGKFALFRHLQTNRMTIEMTMTSNPMTIGLYDQLAGQPARYFSILNGFFTIRQPTPLES